MAFGRLIFCCAMALCSLLATLNGDTTAGALWMLCAIIEGRKWE